MMSVAQIPAVPQQTQQRGTAMDLAAAETVMVIDAEGIPVSVASQVRPVPVLVTHA